MNQENNDALDRLRGKTPVEADKSPSIPKPGDTRVDRRGRMYRYQSDMSLTRIPGIRWDFKQDKAVMDEKWERR